MLIEGFITVGPCAVVAVLIRFIFKWGNKGRRHRPKRERAVAVDNKYVARVRQVYKDYFL